MVPVYRSGVAARLSWLSDCSEACDGDGRGVGVAEMRFLTRLGAAGRATPRGDASDGDVARPRRTPLPVPLAGVGVEASVAVAALPVAAIPEAGRDLGGLAGNDFSKCAFGGMMQLGVVVVVREVVKDVVMVVSCQCCCSLAQPAKVTVG